MRIAKTTLLGVAMPVAVLGAVGSIAFARQQTSLSAQDYLDGPVTWVAFQAEFTRKSADGRGDAEGVVARASDGSYYWAATSATAGQMFVMQNVSKRLAYALPPGESTWTARPLLLPPDGHKPAVHIRRAAVTTSDFTASGFRSYFRNFGRIQQHIVPELNFTSIKTITAHYTEELRNIVLQEPDASSFQPPSGAPVKFLNEPQGFSNAPRGPR